MNRAALQGWRRTACRLAVHAVFILIAFFTGVAHAGEPIRVLVLPRNVDRGETSAVVAAYLVERIDNCKNVELVAGERAGRIAGWLWGGAYDMSDAERWRRLRESVAIDALIEIRAQGVVAGKNEPALPGGTVHVYVNNVAKQIAIEAIPPTSARVDDTWPKSMSALAAKLAQELNLPDADRKAMCEIPIAETAPFEAHYTTLAGTPYGGLDPFLTLSTLNAAKAHWAYDAAAARLCVRQMTGIRRGDENTIGKAAIATARKAMVRLVGTPHESDAAELASIERSVVTSAALDDFEKVLLEVAEPLMKGAKRAGEPDRAPAPVAEKPPAADPKAAPPKGRTRTPPPMQDASKAAARAKEADSPDEIDAIESIAIPKKSGDTPAMAVPDPVESATGKSEFTDEERAGALRLLGRMGSPSGLAFIRQVARRVDVMPRETAAVALAGYHGQDGLDVLNTLAQDDEPTVAMLANRALAQRAQPAPALRAAALKAFNKPGRYREQAGIAFASVATAEDAPQLEAMLRDESPKVRVAARRARLALGLIDASNLALWLRDPDPATVLAAIKRAPAKPEGAVREALVRLTAEPDSTLAWASRDALASSRPTDTRAQIAFAIATAHHYLRQRAIERLTVMKEPWAVDELLIACGNAEPYTRIAALRGLAKLAPQRATPVLVKAIDDPHRAVRLNAAAILAASKPSAGDAPAIRTAISREKDDATKLYLEDAAAIAEGKPLPPARPMVHQFPKDRNTSWLCGGGESPGAELSPYDAYYQTGASVSPGWKKSHDAGKIFFARVSPISHPGWIITDPLAQDSFWLALDAEIPPDDLRYIDGLVYGEETMSMAPGALWPGAWRLFCAEVGIDEKRVAGKLENLNVYEQRAWNHWAMTRVVEGFNRLYDHTKLKLGKLRPGIQVCTFMGEQMLLGSGPNVADFEWKFDVGGVYHYFGDTRKTAYALVRRYKTIWPDRRVLWLSNGIGVYERTPIQYTHQAPTSPVTSQGIRAYKDASAAWLAGADTGWFSIWAFLKWNWVNKGMSSLKGPTIKPEGIMGEPKALEMCVNFAFAGVEEMQGNKRELAAVGKKEIEMPSAREDKTIDEFTINPDDKHSEDPQTIKLRADRRRMVEGFRYYALFLYDLARVFGSLPRNTTKPDALVVQPGLSVWEGSLGDPGSDLLDSFDFLLDINKTPRLDLNHYRYIVVHDPGALTDETIDALSRWLKETPGLLYVYLDLSADNTNQASTPADFSGRLKRDWPWECDIASTPGVDAAPKKGSSLQVKGSLGELNLLDTNYARSFDIKGSRAKPLLAAGDKAVLALWRHPEFKGAVIFDGIRGGGKSYRDALRGCINDMAKKDGIGRELKESIRASLFKNDHVAVTVAGNGPEPVAPLAVDAVTGRALSAVNAGGTAVMFREMQSKYVAAYNGVVVVCEKPDAKFEKAEGGVRVTGGGLIRAASEQGGVAVKFEGGAAPKEIAAGELSDWLVFGKNDGIATVTNGKAPDVFNYVYVRSAKPVTFVVAPKPAQ